MKVAFLAKFDKDLDKISLQPVLDDVASTITDVENARSIKEIKNIRKLKGHKIAYRIRIGEYWIGLFIEKNTVEFARIVHRKDIYKLFP